MRDVRVLHVVTDRDRRGAQVFGTDLATGLSKLDAQNEVVALGPGKHGDGLPIECLGPSRRSWRTICELRRRSKSVDVVVAHGSATLLAASIALFASRVPFVYRQISDPLHWAATWPRRIRVGLYLRRPASIVALSDLAARVLVHHYRLDRGRITVIPNAVPGANFTTASADERADVRERFGLGGDLPMAVYVGALAEEKGVDIAIRAVGAINELQLLVVGDGPERARLEDLASRLAPNRIAFAGALDQPATALASSDFLVLPSRGGDSMPAVLIEAGLSGLAAVTTPVGSITDIVIDGVTGHVVPIDDQSAFDAAVQDLVSLPERRRDFGLSARKHCNEHFTIASTAPAWLELLSEVASRRTRRDR